MVQRKRLKKTTKPAEAPPEPKEETPTPAMEFADEMARYYSVERRIETLKQSIADELEALTKTRDNIKANLTDLLESAGVKKMEGERGTVTLVRPTRHEVDDEYLQMHLPKETWEAITETTTSVVQKKFEQAIVDGLISPEVFQEAVTEVPANKGHTKITLAKPDKGGQA